MIETTPGTVRIRCKLRGHQLANALFPWNLLILPVFLILFFAAPDYFLLVVVPLSLLSAIGLFFRWSTAETEFSLDSRTVRYLRTPRFGSPVSRTFSLDGVSLLLRGIRQVVTVKLLLPGGEKLLVNSITSGPFSRTGETELKRTLGIAESVLHIPIAGLDSVPRWWLN